jgi:serine/threonine protein kinase
MLVLYSRKDNTWKLADFGLTSEGSNTKIVMTVNARGTAGYRAPELLMDASAFTQKSDIWSAGCILFELAIGEKRFATDVAVLYHRDANPQLNIELDGFDENTATLIIDSIQRMHDAEPQRRPPASELQEEFGRYCQPRDTTTSYVNVDEEFVSVRPLNSNTDYRGAGASSSQGLHEFLPTLKSR